MLNKIGDKASNLVVRITRLGAGVAFTGVIGRDATGVLKMARSKLNLGLALLGGDCHQQCDEDAINRNPSLKII